MINQTREALDSSTMLTVMREDIHVEDIFTNVTLATNILTENDTFFDSVTVSALLGARLR